MIPVSIALRTALRPRRLARGALALALATGCDSLTGEDRPYTPFSTATGESNPAPPPPPSAPSPPAAVEQLPRVARVAPPRASRWRIEGRTLQAPAGLVFRLGLPAILGKAERPEVFAWLVGTVEAPSVGELWAFPEEGVPRRLAHAPDFLPTDPSCSYGTRLSQTGPETLTLDIAATCGGERHTARRTDRAISVLAPLRKTPEVALLRVDPAPRGERANLRIDSRDLDGDGRDDVTVEVTLQGAGPEVAATLKWLDRAAGLSPETAQPGASFRALAAAAEKASKSAMSAREAEQLVDAGRRLYSFLCAKGGTPRLRYGDTGQAIDCGDLGSAFRSYTTALVSAALSQQDVGAALAAVAMHEWFPAEPPAEISAFMSHSVQQLMPHWVARRVIKLVPLTARPKARGSEPRYSPLSFHADGSLLLLTEHGLVRSAPDGRYEYEASEEIDPWAVAVVSPSGARIVGLDLSCERAELGWQLSSESGQELDPLPTGLLAPRPGSCGNDERFHPLAVAPIAWEHDAPSGFIDAARVGGPVTRPAMGSAMSPNGRFAIAATRWGLFVRSRTEKPQLWRFEDPALPKQLTDCVVSNNAQAAACVMAGRAYVVLPDPNSG